MKDRIDMLYTRVEQLLKLVADSSEIRGNMLVVIQDLTERLEVLEKQNDGR